MKFDLASIQFRLTSGIVLASILGIGGISGWTSYRMQQILIEGHKQNAVNIAQRFEQDVDLYEEMMPSREALQRVINYRSTADLAIWIRSPDGSIIAQSDTLSMGSWQQDNFAQNLIDLPKPEDALTIRRFQDRYLVICVSTLRFGNQVLGELYVVDDITQNQRSFNEVTRTLAVSSVLFVGFAAVLIALYVNRSLRPIRKMNQLAAHVSASNLAQTHLKLDNPPTEVKELSKTLNLMLERLSEAWEQQRRFVSDVSHELRTPLTLVHGYLQSTLRRCRNLTEPQREGLEIAASEADRTIRLLQDLLDLARADGGHLRFTLEPLQLKDFILEVVGMCSYSSDQVMAEIAAPYVEVKADRNRLKQVLINLIDNAVKYSDASEPVKVRLSQSGEWATIEVCDRGRGIPMADLNKIFDPFYRVDEDRSRATGGTGLGLSIVKTLVEGMSGKLKVQSKLGEGSTFTVSLPT
ncbi:MAG: HAMP domain-containing histidine kinase [Leptolyngbya sp. SIO4C1]|nr:HAMP domain-containing histidine kinase [Leptolyngbya sp. SIO4C1]